MENEEHSDAPLVGAIELTEAEREWSSGIDWLLERSLHVDVSAVYLQNKPLIVPLVRSLLERDAIPRIRRRYVTDSELNIGGYKDTSVIGTFQRNGSSGDDMISHLHFLEYAWYFIHGAKLPDDTKGEFLDVATDPWMELMPLRKTASRLFREDVRRGRLARRDVDSVHEEFFKLALDCGVDDYVAVSVRNHIMQVRASVRKRLRYY